MKVKGSKCLFSMTTIPFLGHWIAKGQIRVDESKLGRLAEWQPPLVSQKAV